jgi:peroxiredoxin Q/BCP
VGTAVEAGYLVTLHVFVVPEDLAVDRVENRVENRGHAVPENKIRERYARVWPHAVGSSRYAPHRRDTYRLRMRLKPGDKAPAISLRDQRGKLVKLSEFKGKPVVVYFYPKADTPGCTAQSCALRDAHAQLKKLHAVVLGISPDPPERQLKFDEKYSLGFPLLADTEHAIAEAYGVWGEKVNYGRKYMGIIRSAFVVDPRGKVAAAFYKVSPKDTVPKVSAALTAL